MIYMQLTSRNGENLQTLLRQAIKDGSIKSFETAQVSGGFIMKHKKYGGSIRFLKTPGPLLATINHADEWQLFEALMGRVAYHFKNEIACINTQFESE